MEPIDLVVHLSEALDARAKAVAAADAWFSGDHPIPDPPNNTAAAVDLAARASFTAMAKLSVTNVLAPVVKVPAARLNVEGFRFSASPTSTDTQAWDIWRRNHLDGDSDLTQAAALRCGSAPVLVWVGPDGLAEITVEDPSQVIIAYEAGSRRRRRAALKRWVDDDDRLCATLYTPTEIYKYQAPGAAPAVTATVHVGSDPIVPAVAVGQQSWKPREVPGEAWPLPNPFGVVPMLEARANAPLKASRFGGGVPEFAGQINEQRKLNATVMDMLITLENQAYRQRWATDWDYPTLDDGKPDTAEMIRAGASRLMVFNNEDGTVPKVGEFAQADFRPFLDVLEFWINIVATSSGTPPYAFALGEMMNVAADMMARIEGIQSDKLKVHSRAFGETWSEVMRLALFIEGNEKAADPAITVAWGEFDRRTATEQANLAVQANALGAPKQATFAMFPGVDQAEAYRWKIEAIADGLRLGPEAATPLTNAAAATEAPGAP